MDTNLSMKKKLSCAPVTLTLIKVTRRSLSSNWNERSVNISTALLTLITTFKRLKKSSPHTFCWVQELITSLQMLMRKSMKTCTLCVWSCPYYKQKSDSVHIYLDNMQKCHFTLKNTILPSWCPCDLEIFGHGHWNWNFSGNM